MKNILVSGSIAYDNIMSFEGSFSEYEENKLKRLGRTEPTRFKYKKLLKDS